MSTKTKTRKAWDKLCRRFSQSSKVKRVLVDFIVAMQSTQALVKFHGNALIISHDAPSYKLAVEELIKVSNELQKCSGGTWETTGAGLKGLVQRIVDPNSVIQQYQIDLIREVLVPYLKKQKDRYFTDQARVRQLNEIIFALSLHGQQHPGISLNMLEKIKVEIQRNQSYLWKSELLTVLETSLAKQWLPIVTDTRQFLINTSGKLLVLGMIGMIGWPIAFFSPILYSSKKLMVAMQEWEQRKRFSNETIVELVKVAFMIILLMQLITIVQFYAALGKLFLGCSALSFLIAQNETVVKDLSPVLAPQAYLIDQFFFHLSQGNMKSALEVVSNGPVFATERGQMDVLEEEPNTHTGNTAGTNNANNSNSSGTTYSTAHSSSSVHNKSSASVYTSSGSGSGSTGMQSSVQIEVLDETEEEEAKKKTTKPATTATNTGSISTTNSVTNTTTATTTNATATATATVKTSTTATATASTASEGLRRRRFIPGI